jgi:hypothetical protein
MNRRNLIKGIGTLIGVSVIPAIMPDHSICATCGTQTPAVPAGYLAFCEPCAYTVGDAIDGGLGLRWKENGWGPFYVQFHDGVPIHGAVKMS